MNDLGVTEPCTRPRKCSALTASVRDRAHGRSSSLFQIDILVAMSSGTPSTASITIPATRPPVRQKWPSKLLGDITSCTTPGTPVQMRMACSSVKRSVSASC
eukprot:221081-Rhodomonas_salina.1